MKKKEKNYPTPFTICKKCGQILEDCCCILVPFINTNLQGKKTKK